MSQLERAIRTRGGRFANGRLMIWQQYMGSEDSPPGVAAAAKFAPFLGDGGEGRLIFRSHTHGHPLPQNERESKDDSIVWAAVLKLERDLAMLGASIANCLLHWLLELIKPINTRLRMRGLRFDHIVDAVNEILGDEWFDVPFDTRKELSAWEERIKLDTGRPELRQVVRLRPSRYVLRR